MKKRIWLMLMFVLVCMLTWTACDAGDPDGIQGGEDSAHVHTFGEWIDLSEASCKTAGLQARNCACGAQETQEIAAPGHTEIVDAAVKGSCTTPSITEGKHCSVCGEVTVAQRTDAAPGHIEVVDAAVDATCTMDGKTEGKHCSVCGVVTVEQQPVLAPGHTEVVDAAVDVTCTEDGLTEGKYCRLPQP